MWHDKKPLSSNTHSSNSIIQVSRPNPLLKCQLPEQSQRAQAVVKIRLLSLADDDHETSFSVSKQSQGGDTLRK